MQTFDPIFVVASAITFAAWCLFFVLSGSNRDGGKSHRLAVNAFVITCGTAIALPWALAGLGHLFFRMPHHAPRPLSLNPWLCVFYALVGELWFFVIWNSSEHAWVEASLYCSAGSVIGAALAIAVRWFLLIVLGPIFLLQCVTIAGEVRDWRVYRQEQERRERLRKNLP